MVSSANHRPIPGTKRIMVETAKMSQPHDRRQATRPKIGTLDPTDIH
jgi:hypothetical protein